MENVSPDISLRAQRRNLSDGKWRLLRACTLAIDRGDEITRITEFLRETLSLALEKLVAVTGVFV